MHISNGPETSAFLGGFLDVSKVSYLIGGFILFQGFFSQRSQREHWASISKCLSLCLSVTCSSAQLTYATLILLALTLKKFKCVILLFLGLYQFSRI